jgi:hypothetical protein
MTKKNTPLVVSYSGGKDSTWLIHHLLKTRRKIAAVLFFDGGWEYDELRQHHYDVQEQTGLKIIPVRPLLDYDTCFSKIAVTANTDHPDEHVKAGQLRHLGYGWPDQRRRWCTDLKTRALDAAAKRICPGVPHAIGLTADETPRLLTTRQVWLRERGLVEYPLVDAGCTQQNALDECRKTGYTWGGLYNHFNRISCWCCPLRSITDWRNLRHHYPYYWQRLRQMQAECPAHHCAINHGSTVEDLETRFAGEDNGTPTKTKHA